jgi:CRP-like cAMP-binding protein
MPMPESSRDIQIDWQQYGHLFKEVEIPAKTILLHEGEISRYGYFIKKGCMRLWFNNKGKDVTFQFFFENEGVSSVESFRSGQPSLFSIESIEPCSILRVSKKNFEKIFMDDRYKGYLDEITFKRMMHYSHLFMSYIKNTPEERYKELLEKHPYIVQRVPQHYIASYLGITSVSLSRIRNRV